MSDSSRTTRCAAGKASHSKKSCGFGKSFGNSVPRKYIFICKLPTGMQGKIVNPMVVSLPTLRYQAPLVETSCIRTSIRVLRQAQLTNPKGSRRLNTPFSFYQASHVVILVSSPKPVTPHEVHLDSSLLFDTV
jgi:hypothetical protein